MNGDLLNDGLNLMAYGMGTVFAFLALLVIATSIMSFVIGKLYPASLTDSSKTSSQYHGIDPQIISAIMPAIKLHRSKHK